MAASSSGSSSFASSSFGAASSNYTQNFASPGPSTFTPASTPQILFTQGSVGQPQSPLQPLDLGPPGYQATIILWEGTPNERTVYLGPWRIHNSSSGHRRVIWQCSYLGETLEHFLPGNSPADVFPHTLHARHRPYSDATELELSVTFREDPHRHRVRYSEGDDSGGGSRVGGGGVVRYDGLMEVRYEFTTHQGSIAFQGDVRDRDLAAYFDVDVVWSDRQSRTDSYGNVRGIATIQRIKIWRDRSSGPFYGPSSYSLSVFANRQERRNREYRVEHFEPDPRADDRHRTVRLNVRGRRQSESETSSGGGSGGSSGRRPSLIRRLRESSSHHAHGHGHSRSSGSGSSSRSATQQPSGWPDVRYLSIQFSSDYDYRRFLSTWQAVQEPDVGPYSQLDGTPLCELPAPPHIGPNAEPAELDGTAISFDPLPPVAEPPDEDIYNA